MIIINYRLRVSPHTSGCEIGQLLYGSAERVRATTFGKKLGVDGP